MLTKRVTAILTLPEENDELLISAISFWEICKLAELGKIILKTDGATWLNTTLSRIAVRVLEITPTIAWASTTLPGNFHRDPADQIIVASAREENATIITKDVLIREYPHVNSIW
jgi:PIN domain nuclease of toxin-antitoxin system